MEPHASQIFLNYTTAVGIILGGLFATWKWGVAEVIRLRAESKAKELQLQRQLDEDPDLEGDVEVTALRLANGSFLLTINSSWRNQGVRNIFLNTKETEIKLYPIDLDHAEISSVVSYSGKPTITDVPFQHLSNLRIGAKTGTAISRFFHVIESGTFLINVRLVRDEKTSDGRSFVWTKQTLISCVHSEIALSGELSEQACTPTQSPE